jgi:hypothetical protein
MQTTGRSNFVYQSKEPLVVNEKRRRKTIPKFEAFVKQLVKQSSGSARGQFKCDQCLLCTPGLQVDRARSPGLCRTMGIIKDPTHRSGPEKLFGSAGHDVLLLKILRSSVAELAQNGRQKGLAFARE